MMVSLQLILTQLNYSEVEEKIVWGFFNFDRILQHLSEKEENACSITSSNVSNKCMQRRIYYVEANTNWVAAV